MNFIALLGLKSKNPDTRRETIESLSDSQDPLVLPHLYPMLKDEDPEVRKGAAKGISVFKDFESVPMLCDALEDKDPGVRIAALTALAKIGDKSITRYMVPLLQDEHNGVQKKVASVLETFRWRPVTPEDQATCLVAQGKLEEAAVFGFAAIEPLSRLLKSSSDSVRQSAIRVLSTIPDSRVLKTMGIGLRDSEANVRLAAVEGLRRIKDVRILDLLAEALKDTETGVRSIAAETLAGLGARAVQPLLGALKDLSWEVRAAAADSLGKLEDARAVEPLASLLNDEEIPVRIAAISSLGRLRDKQAILHLESLLEDESSEIRNAVTNAIRRIDPKWSRTREDSSTVPELTGTPDGNDFWNSEPTENMPPKNGETSFLTLQMASAGGIDTSADDEDDVSIRPLIAELENSDPTVRFKAAKDLAKTGSAGACRGLERALYDTYPPVRRAAAEALERLPWQASSPTVKAVQGIILHKWDEVIALGSDAVDPLILALQKFDSLSQKSSAHALGEIRDDRAVEPLLAALDAIDMGVRKAVVEALGKIGDPRAVEGLMKAHEDKFKPVRDAAEMALSNFGGA